MKISNLLEKLTNLPIWPPLWFLFFFLLPVTSMPAVVNLVRSDVVAAPSGVLLILLLAGWVIPKLLLDGRLSRNSFPLLCFVLISLILTAISFFTDVPSYKFAVPLRSTMTAVLTLFTGLGFFLSAMTWAQDPARLRFAIRILNWSGALMLGWTLLQAFFWYTTQGYPGWMKDIQFALSVGSLYRQRFVGFAYEPSWLAHQLNLLYLPLWLAASITGDSAHERRAGWLTFERLLFFLGTLVLYLTLSRVGIAAFILVLLFYLITRLFFSTRGMENAQRSRFRRLVPLLFLILPAGLLAILWTLTKLDFRMAQLFTINLRGRSDPLLYLAEKLSLATRFVFWEAGLNIFSDHPLTGVGLGKAGYYMPDALSAFALQLVEVRNLLYRSNTLLNIKSIWIRLLAETGIIGFSFFIGWLTVSFADGWKLIRSASSQQKTLGWMACFTLVAFLLEGFSLDTFALPYLWISLGLAGGCGVLADADKAGSA